MSKTVVGMITSYPMPAQVDWLWHQTPEPFGLWGNMQLEATAPNPDVLLLYHFLDFQPAPAKLRWWQKSRGAVESLESKFRSVPRERRIFLLREPPFDEKRSQRIRDYELAAQHCGYVSGPDAFAPTPDYMPAIWYHRNSFRELNDMPPPAKPSTCSWITSGIDRTANHRQRLAFLQRVRDSALPVHIYGRNLPPWANGRGEVANKWHAIGPYRYNLAIENYAENPWYVSEKLWDALLAWCLPIYYGGTAADRLLPPGSFIRLPSLDATGVDLIRDITATPDAWYAAQKAIAEARQIILHQLNLVKWLSDFVERWG